MTDTVTTLIVGAGFAGIGTAMRMLQAGINDFVILERSHRIGAPGVTTLTPAPPATFRHCCTPTRSSRTQAGLAHTRGAQRSSPISTRLSRNTILGGSFISVRT